TSGAKVDNEYDSLGRITQTIHKIPQMPLFTRGYVYSTDHFLDQETYLDTSPDTVISTVRDYSYDWLGRLVEAEVYDPLGAATDDTVSYTYDLNNNLDTKTHTSGLDLSYDRFYGTNRDSVIAFDSDLGSDSAWCFKYDDRGRIIELESRTNASDTSTWFHRTTFTYDDRDLPIKIKSDKPFYEYWDGPDSVLNQYDASGQKVKQTHIYQMPGGPLMPERGRTYRPIIVRSSRWYIWTGGLVVAEICSAGIMDAFNVYGLGTQLARYNVLEQEGVEYDIYHTDGQGSIRAYVRSDGVPRGRMIEYYPYGAVYTSNGSSAIHKFIGKEEDKTGWLDFGPRYYEPTVGRFLAPDPALAEASAYSYAAGNPIMLFDPTGMSHLAPGDFTGYTGFDFPSLGGDGGSASTDLQAENIAREEAIKYKSMSSDVCQVFSSNTGNYQGITNRAGAADMGFLSSDYTRQDAATINGAIWDMQNGDFMTGEYSGWYKDNLVLTTHTAWDSDGGISTNMKFDLVINKMTVSHGGQTSVAAGISLSLFDIFQYSPAPEMIAGLDDMTNTGFFPEEVDHALAAQAASAFLPEGSVGAAWYWLGGGGIEVGFDNGSFFVQPDVGGGVYIGFWGSASGPESGNLSTPGSWDLGYFVNAQMGVGGYGRYSFVGKGCGGGKMVGAGAGFSTGIYLRWYPFGR
ncbi:MAG: RHS repeat-associated core domain-containing protein, partial [bacterium]